jgi:R.Pab1 restriction endonuclease
MRKTIVILFSFICLALRGFGADADYKQVVISTNADSVRVRLPLTDVTGKVRVKEKSSDGFGLPVAPLQVSLAGKHYLEWQIGYDIPTTNSPTVVPEIKFIRNGETKYGHELSKIVFEAVRLGILSTNDLISEIELLKKIPVSEFEEGQTVQVEVSTNASANGFQTAVQRLPQFTKSTPHGWVQIQLKQKQRAVGYQAMVYVCLPMNEVRAMDGSPRKPGPAKSKETFYYDFNRANAAFLLDIIHAFGIASQQHNEDIRDILGKILETARSGASANRR